MKKTGRDFLGFKQLREREEKTTNPSPNFMNPDILEQARTETLL